MVKSVLSANSGFHCVMTSAWPGASISGIIVTPLLAHFRCMFSKSEWYQDSLARLLSPATAGESEFRRNAE